MGDKLRKVYIILATVSGLIGLIVILIVGGTLLSVDRSSDLSQNAKDTMYRAAVLTGTEDTLPVWQREIEQGHLSVSDYVENQFTAHPYLLSGKDDSALHRIWHAWHITMHLRPKRSVRCSMAVREDMLLKRS